MFKKNTGAPTRSLDHKCLFVHMHPEERGQWGDGGREGKAESGAEQKGGGGLWGKEWRRDRGGRGEVRWENNPRYSQHLWAPPREGSGEPVWSADLYVTRAVELGISQEAHVDPPGHGRHRLETPRTWGGRLGGRTEPFFPCLVFCSGK